MDNLRWLVCAGFLMSAVVDTVTGMGALSSLSMVYKACVCIAACITLGPLSLRILVGVSAVFLMAVLHTAMFNNLVSLDLIWVMRNLMLLVATLFFLELFQTAERAAWERRIVLFCAAAFAVFTANVVLGLLGVGQAQYASGTGYTAGGKGFINAGNEMVTAMLAISAILIIATARLSVQVRVALYAVLTLVLVVSGTKSGILGLFLLIGLQEGAGSRISTAQRALMGAMLLFTAWFGYDTLVNSFAGNRFFWFYEQEGLTRALLSNRDYWASLTLEAFFSSGLLNFMLGPGAALIDAATAGKEIVEMDVIDFLVSYGVLGLCAGYTAFAIAARRVWSNHRGEWLAPLSMIGLFFTLSAVSGHVLNGGTSAPYLGAMLALIATGHARFVPVRRRRARRRGPAFVPARQPVASERQRSLPTTIAKPVLELDTKDVFIRAFIIDEELDETRGEVYGGFNAPVPMPKGQLPPVASERQRSLPTTIAKPVLELHTEDVFIRAFIIDEELDETRGEVYGCFDAPVPMPEGQLPPPPNLHWSAER